ncbi:KGK domain-containing protein [Phormidesmis priestleyi]
MDNGYSPLRDDEVLFVDRGRVLMTNPTFKVIEFLDALAQAISDREEDWSEDKEDWFGDGLACEALRFGTGGWQRGRVRIRLEFIPEKVPGKLPERSSASRPAEQPLERIRAKPIDTFYQDSEDARY